MAFIGYIVAFIGLIASLITIYDLVNKLDLNKIELRSLWKKIRPSLVKIWSSAIVVGVILGIVSFSYQPDKDEIDTTLNRIGNYFRGPFDHSGDPPVTCLANDKLGFLSVNPNASLSHKDWIGDVPTGLSVSFQIQTRPITVSEFKDYVASGPRQSFLKSLEGSTWKIAGDHDPAVDIPWAVAQDYGRWITATAKDGCQYRLPTLAEWRQAVMALAHANDDPERDFFYGEFQWGMLEWTEDPCDNKGRVSVGSEWRKENEDDGKNASVPAATCLGSDHVKDGFFRQGFRLVRVPDEGIDE
ncbi:SUMF1/EgtB/PvdO family nonheme iron enzyme [Candidatus Thiosymbion oneisti]|uniref:SUMF1/EgtB/PvdO family nonheme iron enzyme n=1 Tax=Candidatus Thiosymbion oneisti TaxID=589554 RepID=UPI0013FD91A5|nr:SUMF1/EgtB/PvdO family nonheme iron enzyme [Candidatus Thiosymbion oneisti]